MTHDQSFLGLASGISLNDQVQTEELEPLIYGFMFLRICHMIPAMRLRFPYAVILLCKIDLDSAFRRMHLSAGSAVKCICICITAVCAAIYLHLTFGGAFSPAKWCVVIELMTDLAIDITNNPLWLPHHIPPPAPRKQEIPKPKYLDSDIPFAPALPCDVNVNIPRHGHFDSYVDDIIGICVDVGDNAIRTINGILLAINLLARPLPANKKSSIAQSYMLSQKKWIAEGRQEETKTILGWRVDTRILTVSLPEEKYIAYSNQIKSRINAGKVDHKNLQNLVGRLQRASYVTPHSKYFLNQLRALLRTTETTTWANIPSSVKDDLHLWLELLEKGRAGTSINNIVFRTPTHLHWADSCPFGMGGYSTSGRAWRYYIPLDLRSRHTNNVLEYVAIIITIWFEVFCKEVEPLSCCLALSDSTSTVGWLHRANFDPHTKPAHDECSRTLARLMMGCNSTIYAQHQKGKHNAIADILSRWHFLSDTELLTFIRCQFPTQVPRNFRICPLPDELCSWITFLLQKLQTMTQSRSKPTTNEQEHGDDGSPGWRRWAGGPTPTSLGFGEIKRPEWSGPLRSLFAEGNTVVENTRDHWLRARSTRPSRTWQRPLRTTTFQTLDKQTTTSRTDLSRA